MATTPASEFSPTTNHSGGADESAASTPAAPWSIDDARALYGTTSWGKQYFDINDDGDVICKISAEQGGHRVSLKKIVDHIKTLDLHTPVILRIENLIGDRVAQLNNAFAAAIKESGYEGNYRAVFPIKVNQQRQVIESIVDAGQPFSHGLEAGSKAELLVAITAKLAPESLIVCNGYKDEEYLDLAMMAGNHNRQVFIVIETIEELRRAIRRSRELSIRPLLGVRLKLTTAVDGHWSADSGDRGLFGVTPSQLIEIVDVLSQANMLDCLQMLHFHVGSQIPNIRNIRDGLREACRYYIDLKSDGAPMGYLNIGGGLAVDYDGTASTQTHSRNYHLKEYCVDVVETIINTLQPWDVEHPTIISESGRWTVAPMSVLIFDVLAVNRFESTELEIDDDAEYCEPIVNLIDTLENLRDRRVQENYNDTIYFRDQLRELFRAGVIRLRDRALGENIALAILERIAHDIIPRLQRVPQELAGLPDELADIYYGNFSVFQSLPDSWAINQVFPVMPIHRHLEPPDRTAVIADLTCDCDGRLDRFVDGVGNHSCTIPLHSMDASQYLIGVFLVGAYQETLGDFHNLLGDNNVVSVRINGEDQFEITNTVHGDSIADVLQYVEYDVDELLNQFRKRQNGDCESGQKLESMIRESLAGYTYFEE